MENRGRSASGIPEAGKNSSVNCPSATSPSRPPEIMRDFLSKTESSTITSWTPRQAIRQRPARNRGDHRQQRGESTLLSRYFLKLTSFHDYVTLYSLTLKPKGATR